jgi:hypothetical protein
MYWAERLQGILPRESAWRPGPPDWSEIEATWGTRFPSDYRWFCETYGPGSINGFTGVFRPVPWGEGRSTMVDATRTAQESFEDSKTSPVDRMLGVREHPRLIAWGSSDLADDFFWDAKEGDPDGWPIIVFLRDDFLWRQFDMSFSEFLVRALLDELEGWKEPMVFDQPGKNFFEPYPDTAI